LWGAVIEESRHASTKNAVVLQMVAEIAWLDHVLQRNRREAR
jgi:hypothetical protein